MTKVVDCSCVLSLNFSWHASLHSCHLSSWDYARVKWNIPLSSTAWSSEQMEYMNISLQYALLFGSLLPFFQLPYFLYEWTWNLYTYSSFPIIFLDLVFVSAEEVKFFKRLRLSRVAVFKLLVSGLLYTHCNYWGFWRVIYLCGLIISHDIYHIRNYNWKHLF